LPRALAKVRAKLGTKVDIDVDPPPFTAAVRAATERSAVLAIRYWTAGRDEMTSRRVVPRQVFVERGDFYVVADDERSGQERTFRIDRIESVEDTGEVVAPRVVAPRSGQWFDDGGVAEAVLVLEPSAAWVAERYPVRRVTTLDDGRLEVVVPVASERWLGRVLLRLGTTAEVREPDRWTSLAAGTAERVLARYRRD
jgi:proteasome accessory factor C